MTFISRTICADIRVYSILYTVVLREIRCVIILDIPSRLRIRLDLLKFSPGAIILRGCIILRLIGCGLPAGMYNGGGLLIGLISRSRHGPPC